MNKYYIARNYRSKFDAAGKAKMDCETILKRNGWINIGFKQTWISNAILGTTISALGITWALIRLKRKSTLCIQYPLSKFYRYVLCIARWKKCKIITIIHDSYALKDRKLSTIEEISILSKSDVLIVHNQPMKKWFIENNCNAKLIALGIFDYLHNPSAKQIRTPIDYKRYRIVFAGGIGGKKSFIYKFDNLSGTNFKLDVYGADFNKIYVKDKNNTMITYKGKYPSNEVIDHIDGDFGLVWYGDLLDTCGGLTAGKATAKYLKYNNPHKLSLYLQCDMPIIIWDKAAAAEFILENKIGIAVSSLYDMDIKLAELSKEEYKQFKANVSKIKDNLSKGYYLTSVINKIN